eukprot:12715036-Alexandrium_andersonii.AAC.1
MLCESAYSNLARSLGSPRAPSALMLSLAVFADPRSARWRVSAEPRDLQVDGDARSALLHHVRT